MSTDKTAAQAGQTTSNYDVRFEPTRDPAQVRSSEHFLRRFSSDHGYSSETRRDPEITADVVRTCIQEGEISSGGGHTLRYETEIDGHEWRLVIGYKTGQPVAVTAYVPGVHGKGGDR